MLSLPPRTILRYRQRSDTLTKYPEERKNWVDICSLKTGSTGVQNILQYFGQKPPNKKKIIEAGKK